MSTFLFSYRTPKTYTAGSPDNVAAWTAWFQGMGANLVDAGKPVVRTSIFTFFSSKRGTRKS